MKAAICTLFGDACGAGWHPAGRLSNRPLSCSRTIAAVDNRRAACQVAPHTCVRILSNNWPISEGWTDNPVENMIRSRWLLLCLVLSFSLGLRGASTILVGTSAGPYRSTDSGATWKQSSVTVDDPVLSTLLPNTYTLAVDPQNPANVYAVGRILGRNFFLRSTDGGQTWLVTPYPELLFGGGLSIDPVKTSVLYVTSQSLGPPTPTAPLNPVLRSMDSGRTWTPLIVPNPVLSPLKTKDGPMISGIAIDPNTSGVL